MEALQLLTGYREDLDLNRLWWHRLLKVAFLLLFVLVAWLAWDESSHRLVTGGLSFQYVEVPFGERLNSVGPPLAIFVLVSLNVYYRGLVFIVCGPRNRPAP